MNDKKTSQLLVKLSPDLRDAFQAYAKLHGQSASTLIRHFIEDELREGRVMSTLRRPLVDGRWNRPAAEISDDSGKLYHLQIIPFRSQTTLQISDPDTERGFVNFSELRGKSRLLDKVLGVLQSEYDWDTPAYVQLCTELGLDPHNGRPGYKPEDLNIVADINRHIRWGAGGDEMKLNELIFDLLDLLRTDTFPEFFIYNRTKATIDNWTFRLPPSLFVKALARVDMDRMGSTDPIWTTVTFLPSWKGRGYSASIALCGRVGCEPDGWRKNGYQHVRGVALVPTRMDWAMETVLRRLKMQGVVFLSLEEARAYMDGEGAWWAFSQGSWQAPRGLEPRHPSKAEKVLWRIKRPSTPCFDAQHQSAPQ